MHGSAAGGAVASLVAALFFAAAGPQAKPAEASAQATDSALEARARLIHARVITIDSHVDIRAADFQPGRANFATGLGRKVDLPRMEKGGLDAVFFSIFQDQRDDFTPTGYRRAREVAIAKAEAVRRLAAQLAPDRIGLARTAADVRRLHAEGKKAALLGMENGYALGESIASLKEFADLGVRYLRSRTPARASSPTRIRGGFDGTGSRRWGRRWWVRPTGSASCSTSRTPPSSRTCRFSRCRARR